jgi:hypothetical protein
MQTNHSTKNGRIFLADETFLIEKDIFNPFVLHKCLTFELLFYFLERLFCTSWPETWGIICSERTFFMQEQIWSMLHLLWLKSLNLLEGTWAKDPTFELKMAECFGVWRLFGGCKSNCQRGLRETETPSIRLSII